MYAAILLIISFLILPSLARAEGFSLSGYTELGKSSTAEDYEEEGTDDDYTFQNYHLKFSQEVSPRLSYDVSSFIYNKNYTSKSSFDNISRIFKTNFAYYLSKSKEDSLKLDLRLKSKEKRYKNSPRNDYDQLTAAPTLTYKKKDLYSVDLTVGVDDYDYLKGGEKDQQKVFGKIGGDRYFFDKKLMLTSSYRIESAQQNKAGRKKTQNEVMGGFDYLFELPWIYKLSSRVNWGERDTKNDDERDEDYDYEYWRYLVKTEHRINPKLKTELSYQYFKKDTFGADFNYWGYLVGNGWDYEIFDDSRARLSVGMDGEHKEVDYRLSGGNSYRKETGGVSGTYQVKKDWKVTGGFSGSYYDYSSGSLDKQRYYAKLSGEKLFWGGDLAMTLDLKYRFTAYDERDDKEQDVVRVGAEYRF